MSASFLIVAALLLRNPFWPIGYEGEREEISAEMRVAPKAAPKTERQHAGHQGAAGEPPESQGEEGDRSELGRRP